MQTSTKGFFQLLKSLKWPVKITIIAIVLSLLSTVIGLIVPLVTKNLVDTLTTTAFNWKMIGVLLVVFLLQAISGGVSFYLLSYIGEFIVADLRKKLWSKVLHLPVPYYDQNESGETMSRITQDTTTLKSLITDHLVNFVSGIITIIGSVIILFFIDWKMTLIMLISVPLSVAIMMPLGTMMHKVSKATQKEMASFSGLLGRVLSEIRLVKSYRAEKTETVSGNEAIQNLYRFGLKEAKIQAFISPFMTLIMMAILVVILGYGGLQVSKGILSAGDLVAIIFYLVNIIVPFAQMATFFTSFQKAVGATERIQDIFHMDSEAVELEAKQPLEDGIITFLDVHFSYGPDKKVIDGISLEAPPGTVTAFVGPSGGGKTTIFSLLERFYEPDTGEILFNRTPIEKLSLRTWRSKIGYVSQESPLMSGTILSNMTYGMTDNPPMEKVIEAAEAANAAMFIDELPDKYDTLVGERGIKLSGGQRQRIAIARALLHNPKILLLDEATSNLDSGSEASVQEALERLMKGRTTLIIAHRLATIIHADQIFFLEKGKITGAGTHDELIANHDLYREFTHGQGLS
ncbi:ABC transporter ATP-binding protein [Psychrobacillus sp. OK032]|uniref:ABC transporter ATP-binding protein n=1 Tax=Psychrobacillus sp. OK032 TaxID=1884358 RepID=UPI0008AF23FB|nr:ABC transporter ATP-binding protein [Psychrobacillus sp. OK032]SES29221.1 ATP-binding cassette, subfamily B, AbcA/BmrA [Psychrobacillus sp. OK032]